MSFWYRLKVNLTPPKPVGPETIVRRFSPDLDEPLAADLDIPTRSGKVVETDGGWRFVTNVKRVFPLFELHDLDLDNCMLIYRAELRSRDVDHGAYLEMWCHVPRDGEYFSKGTHRSLKGDNGWKRCETHIPLREGQRPDRVKLILTIEGYGVVEMRNVELLQQPLPTTSTPRRAFLTALWLVWRTLRFTSLVILNIPLFALSAASGGDFLWWPRRNAPEIGKLAG